MILTRPKPHKATTPRFPDLESFIRERWEGRFLANWDANDLITLVHTWQNGDVSKIRDDGNLEICLSKIKSKGLIMPSKTDLYFPVRCGPVLCFSTFADASLEYHSNIA